MSITNANLGKIVLKQSLYKLNANTTMLLTLIILQLIGISLSLGGSRNTSGGNGHTSIHITGFTAEIPVTLTFMSIFIIALLIAGKYYRNMDFTLVSSKTSGNLSSLVCITLFSVFSGITGALSEALVHIGVYFIHDRSKMVQAGFHIPVSEVLELAVSITFYCLLLSSIAYLFGTIVQFHGSFAFLLPAALVSIFIYEARMRGGVFYGIVKLFTSETSLPIFAVKSLAAVLLIFAMSMLLSNRLEVRK
jgi:hypothetical protein